MTAHNPAAQWTWREVLANRTNYLLELLIWQNGYNPKKKAEHLAAKPKPFVPEFMAAAEREARRDKEIEPHTVEDIKAILARPRR